MKKKFLEILPGGLSWFTLIILVFLSWRQPIAAGIFIIFFDIYWLCKTIFLYLHLRIGFQRMSVNLKTDWLKKLTAEQLPKNKNWRDIYHLIVLPFYQESYEVVRESFLSLRAVNYPQEKIIVALAVEERAGSAGRLIAQKISAEFQKDFFKLIVAVHPSNQPGEIPAKGSNATYAVKEAQKLIDSLAIPYKNILVSSFDVDTQTPPDYFGILTYKFLTAKNPHHSSYQPIPVFTNNIYQAPALGRVISFSTTFWMMMRQAWSQRLCTFSSHSMPFQALTEVDFWQTNIVSEDSRIFWQCFLHYQGNWRVKPLFYPVYMDANVASTFWQTMKNLYKQQRRWAWGVENIPYVLAGFAKTKIAFRKKFYRAFCLLDDAHSWATNALLIFIFGRLPVLIGGNKFKSLIFSYNLPRVTGLIMLLTSLGIPTLAVLALMLLPPKTSKLKIKDHVIYLLQWILMPFVLIVFGCFPALEAQTRLMLNKKFHLGFWHTPKRR